MHTDSFCNTDDVSILVVEDDAVTLMFMQKVLIKAGFRVLLAANGQEACELFSQRRFDLIFMDIQMPVLNGIETAQKIRKAELETSLYTPIVALTANVNQSSECFEVGMDGFLSKPVSVQTLFRTISKFVTKEVCLLTPDEQRGRETLKEEGAFAQETYAAHYKQALRGLANAPSLFEDY